MVGGSKEILKFKFGGLGAPEKENALTQYADNLKGRLFSRTDVRCISSRHINITAHKWRQYQHSEKC